jgi:hypothetical protein
MATSESRANARVDLQPEGVMIVAGAALISSNCRN